MPDLFRETKAALTKLHISPRKKLGQNFMVNEEALRFIRDSLSLKETDTVLEIGPGLGFLTRFLLEKSKNVIAVEKDAAMVRYLKDNIDPPLLLEKDILKLDLERDLSIKTPIKVVGNIPYSITSPILEWLISQKKFINQAVLTMQWEVASRLKAEPGTKAWGALSIFVQVHSKVHVLRKISKGSFYPMPKVDSAAVQLDFSNPPNFGIKNEENFFKVVRKAFQKRRKTLPNSLVDDTSAGFSKELLGVSLRKAGINPSRRPETLSIPEWALLSQILF